MNIEFLRILAKKHPCIARAINLGILSAAIYFVSFAANGGEFHWQTLMGHLLFPVLGALEKYKRNFVN